MTATADTLISMLQAQQVLAEEIGSKVDYDLVRFLMRDRQIPTVRTGRSTTRWLPPESFELLRQAAIEFLAKPESN